MPWPKLLAVARRRDDGARGGVDVAAPVSAGAHGGEAGELRLEDDVVDAAQLVRRLAGGEGARDVAAVAVHARAGVDHDELAGSDDPLAGDGVRLGAVVAGGDDRREGLALGAQAVVLGAQVPRHVRLAAAHEAAGHDRGERLVGHRPGAPHDARSRRRP